MDASMALLFSAILLIGFIPYICDSLIARMHQRELDLAIEQMNEEKKHLESLLAELDAMGDWSEIAKEILAEDR